MKSKAEPAGPAPRAKSSLLTVGSVAVLAVYAAGFFKTRAAAQRFDDVSEQRRNASQGAPSDTSHMAVVPLHFDTTTAPAPKAAPRRSVSPPAARVKPVVTAPKIDSQPPIVIATPTTAEPPVAAQVTIAADTTPPPAEKPPAKWKDGTYLGYGTSRHGDIQASVEIKDGQIIAAKISQCLTRYSCSWISHLPGQVVTRQSANVDYVSGATQSSNAFYQAITEALFKAK